MKIKELILGCGFLLLFCGLAFSDSLPTAEDINSLARNAEATRDTFFTNSYQMRLRYQYAGKFPTTADCNELKKIAKTASDQLEQISQSQQRLKSNIENYQGDDWEGKYGTTGLWRKVSANLLTTIFNKCQVDYYRALTEKQPKKNEILNNLLDKIKFLENSFSSPDLLILKAKTYGLLASSNPTYEILAKKHFDSLIERLDIGRDKTFLAEIERINLLGEQQPGDLDKLARELADSSWPYNTELILQIAFLQRRMKQMEGFEKTVTTWPQIQNIVGSFVLEDLYNRNVSEQLDKKNLQQFSIIEAELAANVAWKDNIKNYIPLLTTLTQHEKFQTALILYVAAAKLSPSSPIKATELLIQASQLQQNQPSKLLELAADKIAEQAANYGLQLFIQHKIDCDFAIKAFDNYQKITNDKANDELQYYYVNIFDNCNEKDKADKLLENLAATNQNIYSKTAKLDMIINKLKQKNLTRQEQFEYLRQLPELISTLDNSDEKEIKLRNRAIDVYCRYLLEFNEKGTAEKVLKFLDTIQSLDSGDFPLFKSRALEQLGKFEEAIKYMCKAVDFNNCQSGTDATELIKNLISRIDEFENDLDFLDNCKKLAEYGYNCSGTGQNGLILAEISILTTKQKDKLSEVGQLLKTVERLESIDGHILLRCKARLLTEQSRFSEAATLWSQINKTLAENSVSVNTHDWQWWRAKYYELYCWSRLPATRNVDVLHNIEVLENSYTTIPQLWSKKLNSLKQRTSTVENSS